MKGLLKNLGLILILVGVVILLACSFTGNVNNNAILGSSVVLVVLGLISYIVINKKIPETFVSGIFYFSYQEVNRIKIQLPA